MIHKTLINFFFHSFSFLVSFLNKSFFQQIVSVFHVPQAKLEMLLVARTVLRDSTKIQQLKQFALIVTKEKLLPKDLLPVKYVLPANMLQQKVVVLVLNVHKDGNVRNLIHLQLASNVKLELLQNQIVQNHAVCVILDNMDLHLATVSNVHPPTLRIPKDY